MTHVTMTACNEQWASRPADERYTSLTELQAQMHHIQEHSRGMVVPSKSVRADLNGNQLVIARGDNFAVPNHWSFGQLCSRFGVPAGYMREIGPRELVVDCINEGISRRDVEDLGLLLYQNGGPKELHAATGPNYGRIWNSKVSDALVEAFGDGRTGSFRIPGEFGKQVPITKENTTLYASDRDMVVFLADEDKSLEVPNRRDGKAGRISQGFACGNSDVGGGRFWFAGFGFDYFCKNRMIWGLTEVEEVSFRHTASAPHRFLSEVVPVLQELARSNLSLRQAQIVAAQNRKVQDVEKFLLGRKFNRAQVSGMKAAFKTDEQRELVNNCSVWDSIVAATAYARSLQYQDARVTIEREAGRMLLAV